MAETESPDEGEKASESPQAVPPFRPRIAHYLLCCFVCSVVVAVRGTWVGGDGESGTAALLATAYSALNVLLDSLAITSLLILIGRGWRYGRAPLRHPGHWMLALAAFAATMSWLFALVMDLGQFYRDSMYARFFIWNLNKLVMCSTVGVGAGVFAWAVRGNRWWKSTFLLLSVVLIALVPQHVFVLFGTYRTWFGPAHNYACLGVGVGSLPLMLSACWADHLRSVGRDWVHWLGVVVIALTAVVESYYAMHWIFWA